LERLTKEEDISQKKHRVEVFFDDEEYAILKKLSTGVGWSIEKLVYDSVFRAHFTEEAKKRHEAFRSFFPREPIDWGADWKELEERMEKDRAWQTLKSMGQNQDA
jgi:hypothetical protein